MFFQGGSHLRAEVVSLNRLPCRRSMNRIRFLHYHQPTSRLPSNSPRQNRSLFLPLLVDSTAPPPQVSRSKVSLRKQPSQGMDSSLLGLGALENKSRITQGGLEGLSRPCFHRQDSNQAMTSDCLWPIFQEAIGSCDDSCVKNV